MIRSAGIVLAISVAMLAGCARPSPAHLVYRPEFLHQETATPSPAGMVFDPPALADASGFGRDVVNGVDLNSRPIFQSSSGLYEGSESVSYQLRYYERHSNRRADDGYLDRTFIYYRTGVAGR